MLGVAVLGVALAACGRDLFRQIDEDLHPFEQTGITRELLSKAHCAEGPGFRVQIRNGTMWVAGETMSYESRALSVKMMIYTVLQRWGLPDLDFVVSISDYPPPETVIPTRASASTAPATLPIFAMARTARHRAILFPDHTFWNWHEASTPG